MLCVRNDFECSFCRSPLVEDVTCRVLAGSCCFSVVVFALCNNNKNNNNKRSKYFDIRSHRRHAQLNQLNSCSPWSNISFLGHT